MDVLCSNCRSLLAGKKLSIPPTPVPIGTTAIPSISEESAIRGWLLDVDSDLSRLEGEIRRAQAVLDALQRKHQVLSDARKQHTLLLSPVRRLPVELLSEIFVLSLPGDWKERIHDFRRAVMLPASICKHWRNVALSTPKLWNSISFRLKARAAQADVDLAQTWVARSGRLLLSIRFFGLHDHDPNLADLHPVIDVIVAHAHRWGYADFELTNPLLNQIHSAKYRLPHLHTLLIGHSHVTDNRPPIDVFEVAPQLNNLTISHIVLGNLTLSWTRLTTIHMSSGFTFDECHEVLGLAPNLVECILQLIRSQSDSSRAMICHIHLRTFHIDVINAAAAAADDDAGEDYIGTLFDRLSLPSLRSFIYTTGVYLDFPQAEFISFLTRSSCTLDKLDLSLWASRLTDDGLIECLRLMPSLVHLQLRPFSRLRITDEILALLTLSNS